MEVFGDDREVEFIQMKRWLESMFDKRTIEFNHKSCEMIADSILSSVWTNYCMIKPRHIIVEVNEDGENGAIVDNCYNLVSLNG